MQWGAVFAGLGVGLGLIVAIGAQNVFVLRQGIRREHVLAVALVCIASDLVLITVGVAGLGGLIASVPWLLTVARWAGAAFLLGYGFLAARRAWRGGASLDATAPRGVEQHRIDAAARSLAEQGADADARSLAEQGADADARSLAEQGADADGRPIAEERAEAGTVRTAPRLRVPTLAGALGTAVALTWLNPHVYLDTVVLMGSIASTHGDDRWWFALGAGVASTVWFLALGFGARWLGRWLRTERAWRILDAAIAVVMVAIAASLVLPTG